MATETSQAKPQTNEDLKHLKPWKIYNNQFEAPQTMSKMNHELDNIEVVYESGNTLCT